MNAVKKFDEALKVFIDRYKKKSNVIGILLSGSYVHSKPDKNSDLDVYVILKSSTTRERGNTWIDGVEIEYFINPVKQVRQYFKEELIDGNPSTIHMLANSIILYKNDSVVDNLISEAKKLIKLKSKPMTKESRECARYHIDDNLKDLEDVYINHDDFAFNIIADELIFKCVQVFFNFKRISKDKSKRLRNQIKKIDSKYEKLLAKAVLEKNRYNKLKALKNLTNYTETLIGGKRPKEWNLRSKCTY